MAETVLVAFLRITCSVHVPSGCSHFLKAPSKEIQHTCRINMNTASSGDIGFLKAIKDKYTLCLVCDGISESNCNTIGICPASSYCYRGHNPDHRHNGTTLDKYIRPAALTHGCCDRHDSHCHSMTLRSLKIPIPIFHVKANYSIYACHYNVCAVDTLLQKIDVINKVYREDGRWSSWSHWSSCSVSCGKTGHRSRTRTCTNPAPAYGGHQCSGHSSTTNYCSYACPRDGRWSSWSHWSSCSESCGKTGHRTRTRSCTNPTPAYGGHKCSGHSSDSKSCLSACPINGHWGHWSTYSACSVTCCTGNKTRTRLCDKPLPEHGGKHCSGSSKETSLCINSCKGDAHWSSWGVWSVCSASCSTGTKTRTRICTNQSSCTGPCVGHVNESTSCDNGPCPVWSAWFYGPCSVTCGSGSKQGIRRCSSGHEEDCTGPSLKTETCNDTPCPVNGIWSLWQAWGTCSKTCDMGNRTRHRTCDNPAPAHGGKDCHGTVSEMENCKVKDCPHWGSYYEASACSVTCGQGVIQIQRNCSTGNSYDCTGSAYDERPCSRPSC